MQAQAPPSGHYNLQVSSSGHNHFQVGSYRPLKCNKISEKQGTEKYTREKTSQMREKSRLVLHHPLPSVLW